MAWQLIYTSAPRSLAAGRSGFGTVARHREISPLLVAALERASQFSRLPGADTGRVIYSYRIIVIGGGRFHVLSSIRDAGADYTGRTNHLAHHLVAEPREIARLGADGPSPADVMLGMRWATSWTEQPRYLEQAEEIALGDFPVRLEGAAWQRLTGDVNQAWLLASGEASRGAYVIHPAGVDLREIFAESLRRMPERLWQISFTTSLQPSDEPADFRWIGIEENSPLRVQTETSGRPIFNLAQPAKLPAVEVVQQAAPALSAAHIAEPQSALAAMLTPETARATWVNASPSVVNAPPATRTGNERLMEPPRSSPTPSWRVARTLWLVGGATAVMMALLSCLVFALKPTYRRFQHRRDVKAHVETVLKPFVWTQDGFGDRLRNELETELLRARSEEAMDVVDKLAETASNALAILYQAKFDDMTKNQLDVPSAVNKALNSSLADLNTCLSKVADIHRELSAIKPQQTDYNPDLEKAFEPIRKLRDEAKLQNQAQLLKLETTKPEMFKLVTQKLNELADLQQMKSIFALLKDLPPGREHPDPPIEWFEKALLAIEQSASDTETEKLASAARKFVSDWKFIDGPTAALSVTERNERRENGEKSPVWPEWLKMKFAGRGANPSPTSASVTEKTPVVAGGASAQAVNAKAIGRMRPQPALYFVDSTEKLSNITIKELVPDLEFELRSPNGEMTKLHQQVGKLRQDVRLDNSGFQVGDGKLLAETAAPKPPFVLVGRKRNSGDAEELLRVYVGFPLEREALFAEPPTLKLEGESLKVSGELPRFVASLEPHFAIIMPANSVGTGAPFELTVNERGECDLKPVLALLRETIASKRSEAKDLSKQATDNLQNGKSMESLRAQVNHFRQTLKWDKAKEQIHSDASTPSEIVGSFVKALAIDWNLQASSGGSTEGQFDSLANAGNELYRALDEVEKARSKLEDVVQDLQKTHHGSVKEQGFRNIRTLTDSWDAILGKTKVLEENSARMQADAEVLNRKTNTLEELPLNKGILPQGEYVLVCRFKGTSEEKIFTFSIPPKQ